MHTFAAGLLLGGSKILESPFEGDGNAGDSGFGSDLESEDL